MREQIFSGCKTPDPPDDLRMKVLIAARQNLKAYSRLSFVDQCWQSRSLHLSWLAIVSVLFLFLILWNPPLPEISDSETTSHRAENQELLELDPTLSSLYFPPGRVTPERFHDRRLFEEKFR